MNPSRVGPPVLLSEPNTSYPPPADPSVGLGVGGQGFLRPARERLVLGQSEYFLPHPAGTDPRPGPALALPLRLPSTQDPSHCNTLHLSYKLIFVPSSQTISIFPCLVAIYILYFIMGNGFGTYLHY